jgi:hypothetical protein
MENPQEICRNISFLEKLLVNFALPLDITYHSIRSQLVKDKYSEQSFSDRTKQIWSGKIRKYGKLLIIKEKYGEIPPRIRAICKDTPCGYMRLMLTYFRLCV